MLDLWNHVGRGFPGLAIAQGFVPAKIIAHANEPVIVALIAARDLLRQRHAAHGRLVFALAIIKVGGKRSRVGRTNAGVVG